MLCAEYRLHLSKTITPVVSSSGTKHATKGLTEKHVIFLFVFQVEAHFSDSVLYAAVPVTVVTIPEKGLIPIKWMYRGKVEPDILVTVTGYISANSNLVLSD